jgi:hypothetical protein
VSTPFGFIANAVTMSPRSMSVAERESKPPDGLSPTKIVFGEKPGSSPGDRSRLAAILSTPRVRGLLNHPHPLAECVPYKVEVVVEVDVELAGHEDILEEHEDLVDMLGERLHQASLSLGLAAGAQA